MNQLCKHYLECGGCELQHLNAKQYLSYKNQTLLNRLAEAKITPETTDHLFIVGTHKRRRCIIQVGYENGKILLGFYKKKSHVVVDMHQCLVLTPNIFELLSPLRVCLTKLTKPKALKSAYILDSHSGIDLVIHASCEPQLQCLEILVKFATENNLARVGWQVNDKILSICSIKPITSCINNLLVDLPPGTFLQATKKCEELIQKQIQNNVTADTKKIIDLYAGCGTFSLIFEQNIQVVSVEGDKNMASILNQVIRRYNLKNVQAITQDLFRHPISATELSKFDLAIIDPPRNGALPQIKELAKSRIKAIMMISCNIDSFIRDAKLLIENGYKLHTLTPIDQFYWTKHLELSAYFLRC